MRTRFSLIALVFVTSTASTSGARAEGLWQSLYPEACRSQQATGAVVGALVGGLFGNAAAAKKNKTEGTVLGAGVGGFVGSQIGRAACEKKLREAMVQQAGDTNRSVQVPAGPYNAPQRVDPGRSFVTNDRRDCKEMYLAAVEDGSAPGEPLIACRVGDRWVEQG